MIKDLIRRLKISYMIYNFFHRKELYHNELIYKKLGLNKKYYSPISSKDFKNITPTTLDTNDINYLLLRNSYLYKSGTNEDRKSLDEFDEKGYAILRNYLSQEQVDEINKEVDTLLKEQKIKITNINKIMFAIHTSALLRSIGADHHLNELLSILLNGNSVLFQSINFITGSEQHTHSDSIHMTTYPLGGLLGVWIALDDITKDNGPLHYYPGSHKLPYYLNEDYDNEGNSISIGDKSYKAYEDMIEEKIKEQHLTKVSFLANKGDLLIWHANLFHGGDPHVDKSKTRRSMVLHYFKEGSVCYHEITQRPALIVKGG